MKLLTANEAQGVFPESYYVASAVPVPDRASLKGELRADVCVIGGGFTGLSAALHLAKAGYSVVLLEAHRVGWGASGRNGGQLGSGQRIDQPDLEAAYGEDAARAMWDIARESVALVKSLVAEHKIKCDLKPGIIHANHRKRYDKGALELVDHMSRHYNYDLQYLPPDQLRDEVKSPRYSAGVLDAEAGHLHPLQLARGLATAADVAGAQIFEMSEVLSIEEGKRPVVATATGRVSCDFVVLGCNGYLDKLIEPVASKVMPINNFIVATERLNAQQQRAMIANDYAVADSKFVVNYFRFSADGRLLFGGKESYGYRYPADIKSFVRKAMVDIFPQSSDLKIEYGWGGTLAITMSRLPFLRRLGSSIYNASGYSGHGVGMATMSGKLIAEAIQGQSERFDVMAAIEAAGFPGGPAWRHPLLVAAMLWYSLRDRF